ncbi:histone-like nucleoid-structuring protein Lsr2 [Leifsonia sp. 21MFCrub1.1]|uniref:histone-like nucleoid-structuring protein Lsr2 n=1 Tax=Leifsonia sp. 21MFCrub1.1 TaxID=1798223 RepID=UPI000892A0E7|nr:Lsr2 family protein [Leifsonia sp. 21MFCrub1.1]SEA31985.1 Lsr2 protein [Leifsonia sp. 21MFCrub1.1]
MAKRVTYQLIDDLDQSVIPEGEGETIEFSLSGAQYVIDLSSEHAEQLRADFAKWIEAAGRNAAPGSDAPPSADERRAIREWARANGVEVGARGQIPRDVVEAFRTGRPTAR